MYNYFNFNGTQINHLAIVTKIEKPYVPERTISTINVTSRDGEIYDGSKYQPIKIPISMAIIGDSEEDYVQRVKAIKDILSPKEEVPIKFAENCSIYGMLNGEFIVTKKNNVSGYADIELICHIPFTYGDNVLVFEPEDSSKKLNVNYAGQIDTLPFISIGFTKDCHFAQVQNINTGERILIGDYPKLNLTTKVESNRILWNKCQSLSELTLASANIDGDRSTSGSLGISSGGECYILSSLGDGSTTWKGACGRIALPSSLDEFKIRAKLNMYSTGLNGDPNMYDPECQTVKETVVSGKQEVYYQVTCSTLNVRSQPNTSSKILGTVSKGYKITTYTIADGWCKFSYKTKTGYVSAKYITKKINDTSTSTVEEYTVENMWVLPPDGNRTGGGYVLRKTADPNGTAVVSIPFGTKVRVIKRNYNYYVTENGEKKLKYTFYRLYKPYTDKNGKTYTGYIRTDYLQRASEMNTDAVDYTDDPGYADDKTGTVELYGFDINGNQIFKMSMFDDNEWFEYNQPQVRIGTRVVLKSTSKTPTPKPKTTTTTNSITTSNYLGGTYGDWNDTDCIFTLIRKKVNNQYVWECTVQKTKGGTISKTQTTKNIRYTDLPTAELSYLALYIGTKASSMNKASAGNMSDLQVFALNPESEEEQDILYFKEGDIIDLDFENGNCYLNEELRNDLVDIGSTYFTIQPGETQLSINSDDSSAVMTLALREKWLGIVDEDIATVPDDTETT